MIIKNSLSRQKNSRPAFWTNEVGISVIVYLMWKFVIFWYYYNKYKKLKWITELEDTLSKYNREQFRETFCTLILYAFNRYIWTEVTLKTERN